MEAALLTNNREAPRLVSTQGQLDLAGASRQTRRRSRSLGSGGHRDASVTMKEPGVTLEARHEPESTGTHHESK